MLTVSKARMAREAIWSSRQEFAEEHEAFLDGTGVTPEEVRELLDGAIAYFERQEDAFRAAGALDLGAVIETNTQKKDGTFLTQLSLSCGVMTFGTLCGLRGKQVRVKVYDPQAELPLEYGDARVPEPTEPPAMGGLLPEPVEVVVEEDEGDE